MARSVSSRSTPYLWAKPDVEYDQLQLPRTTDAADDRRTPRELYDALDREFGFTLDAAASDENALCERYFTAEQDGLVESWGAERVWCNPPFSSLPQWVRKAWLEHERAQLIVMLIPANRTALRWWGEMVEPYRDRGDVLTTRFIQGRVEFLAPGDPNRRGGAPFGCALLVWLPPRDKTSGTR